MTKRTRGRPIGFTTLGVNQKHILWKLANHDGWWSPSRPFKLGVGYRVTRILDSLKNRGLLSENGGVYTLTVAGRQEIQKNEHR